MKNKKTKVLGLFSAVALVLAMGVTSCSKDGEAGAKGDAGAQGPAGPAGPQGPAGAQGPVGTANVIYSPWTDVTYQGVDNSQPKDGTIDYYQGVIAAAKLDDNILKQGEIKVYLNLNSAAEPVVVSIPFQTYITPLFVKNNIALNSPTNEFSTVTDNGVKYKQYRYILIPGGTTARTNINWNDYKQVQKYLGLKD